MSSLPSSKYFEILSHPIRYSILQYIDINIRSFTEIKDGISTDKDIISSQLSFHLKKLQDENILIKNDNYYSISDIGSKLLSLINKFEDESSLSEVRNSDRTKILKPSYTSKIKDTKEDLVVIKRPADLTTLASVFEYFEGKNYECMEEKCFLSLPVCISLDKSPKNWIKDFSKQLLPLMEEEKSKDWLIDRYLKLGYGTRGLQDYGLMDASVSVPPLDSFFNIIIELLVTRGKAGIYGQTGMGKSRLALYIASYWSRVRKTPIIYIQNPHYLRESDHHNLQEVINKNIVHDRNAPKWLIIIEDAHLVDENQLYLLKKLITGASHRTYSIFVSFTKIDVLKDPNKSENPHIMQIEQLFSELIPNEWLEELDLQNQWKLMRPYFYEWIKWVAVDILFDYLPSFDINEEENAVYKSPWSFVVSLGFLKSSLKHLKDSMVTDRFPLILYYTLAQLYVMRYEKGISLKLLLKLFNQYFNQELNSIYGNQWEEKLTEILNSWTNPSSRLLPPNRYAQKEESIFTEGIINFYHLQWAIDVCQFLDNAIKGSIFDLFFINMFPILYKIWNYLNENSSDKVEIFTTWLRRNVKFELHDEGDVLLTTLILSSKEKRTLQKVEYYVFIEHF